MRILYLTFNAPPVDNIASFRTRSYLNYLPEAGIHVDVLTRYYDDKADIGNDFEAMKSDVHSYTGEQETANVYATDFYNYVNHSRFYSRTKSMVRVLTNLVLLDPYCYGWKKYAMDYFHKNLRKHHYDLIIATHNPLITFVVAQKLSKRYKIPWIAEYRDSYIEDTDQGRRLLFKKMVQHRALSGAQKIIVVAESMGEQLQQTLYGSQRNREIWLVRNGYDETVQPAVKEKDLPVWNRFRELKKEYDTVLLHTGTLYAQQDHTFFLDSIKHFNREQNKKICLLLVGLNKDGMDLSVLMQADVFILPRVEQSTSLAMLADADVLVIPAWNNSSKRSFPAKIYEYIWFGKRVLCSPDPPADFSDFIGQYPNVTVLKQYQDFEQQLLKTTSATAADDSLSAADEIKRDMLTRRYWMKQLAGHLQTGGFFKASLP